MLYIYTEEFFVGFRIKNLLKKFLGKYARGPQGVFQSLCSGLTDLKVGFYINAPPDKNIEMACVLSGLGTLKFLIAKKKQGWVKKIVAGPNIVVTPFDYDSIIQSPEIDLILCPSQWVVDWWV